VELIELNGKANCEVLEELSRVPSSWTSLYSDVRLAGLSTEAAVFGKPTIVGGYAVEWPFRSFQGFWSRKTVPPVFYCNPGRDRGGDGKFITDDHFRSELGERARRFVEARLDAGGGGETLPGADRGTTPANWFFAPHASATSTATDFPKRG